VRRSEWNRVWGYKGKGSKGEGRKGKESKVTAGERHRKGGNRERSVGE